MVCAVILRVHLVVKGKDIIKELSSLKKVHSKYMECPQKSLKRYIIAGSILGYITAVALTCFDLTPQSLSDSNKIYFFGMTIPETYADYTFSFAVIIISVNNVVVCTGQDVAIVLICSIYQKLGCFIADSKKELITHKSEVSLTPKVCHNFAKTVDILSTSVIRIDSIISPLSFYSLCLFLFQVLKATSLFMRSTFKPWDSILGICILITLIPKLILLVMLGSRIHERFAEIKALVLKAPVLNERIWNETPSGINHITLCQIVDSMSENSFMTAMGVIKIEKSVILSILCAFISYSVLIIQVFHE
ncbi:hypothetical protein TNCT_124681 [Trichonephila clavata]|uniref:Uncharacterized protein n=1 Tax=Trichonephila clavata TaxID=2740835 RepID=A0A8X6H1A9_TRICU|nr:hypothetical protein TNCT_124681 [Trichonephila clavata]